MSLSHVLLTSLLEQPSTGIELARRFDRSMGFFWQATHQQIYRELGLMQRQAWISPLPTSDPDSRKKTYQVTALGLQQLRQWMRSTTPPTKTRDALMVKLRAEAQLAEQLLLPEILLHLHSHQQQLALYQGIAQRDQQKSLAYSPRQVAIQQQILALGISFEQLWITWLTELAQVLEQHSDPD
jgi:DNA-binding PadR family transcriptional regulator